MDLARVLDRLATRLPEQGIEFALIGGIALAAHGAIRATVDLDLLVGAEGADDLDRLLRHADQIDLDRVRDYFRLFDREAELDALLAELKR